MPDKQQSLDGRLKQKIRNDGPITIEAFMEAALTDPDEGYYRQRAPLGVRGDFVTAPEISQIFGELIGLWTAEVWREMGARPAFHLIELGPGRGTLMSDALRALTIVPEAIEAAEIHLVELSARLRAEQQATLRSAHVSPRWHERLDEVPSGPSIIIANEFVDALPVRQFVRCSTGWHERCVDVCNEGQFVFTECATPICESAEFITRDLGSAELGSIAELCPGAEPLINEIAARAGTNPTVALIIDYGHLRHGTGDTLQAVRNHQTADPLKDPGRADLTAHVDFAHLAACAAGNGLAVYGPMTQRQFLLSLGLRERLERLVATATPEQVALLSSGAERLVDPEQMGDLFKVIAFAGPSGLELPAF
ncbi:MAG: class I SAM-dependent methyltransferase [Methyloligellaceae bacterium]